jgi:UDP-2-acetamido-3-amino-2,3-dideoxy-glucuronate N-acetyltransferase
MLGMSVTKNIVVLGTGYWGINHVRNFHELGALYGVYDANHSLVQKVSGTYPDAKVFTSLQQVFSDPNVHGVVVASPATTHFEITKEAMLGGKDVLVEKPLALKLSQAKELVELAEKKKRVLMVGHLLRYHPALIKLKEMIQTPEFGALEYIYSNRLNLGKIRTEENILWSFAPHDVSTMLWLTESLPIQANVVGGNYLQPNITDITISTFLFDNGVRAHIFVSWLHPFKEQRLVVVGSKKMIVFNDQAEKDKKLTIFDKSVELINGQFVTSKPAGVLVPYDHTIEPLKAECTHFLGCIETRATPHTDGQEGMMVLKVLQSCQRSLQMNGQPVQVVDHAE